MHSNAQKWLFRLGETPILQNEIRLSAFGGASVRVHSAAHIRVHLAAVRMYSAAVQVYSAGLLSALYSACVGVYGIRQRSSSNVSGGRFCSQSSYYGILFAMTPQRVWRGMHRSRLALLLAVSPANPSNSLEYASVYV